MMRESLCLLSYEAGAFKADLCRCGDAAAEADGESAVGFRNPGPELGAYTMKDLKAITRALLPEAGFYADARAAFVARARAAEAATGQRFLCSLPAGDDGA